MTKRYVYFYVYLYKDSSTPFSFGIAPYAAKNVEAIVGPFDNSGDRQDTLEMMERLHGHNRVKAGTLMLHDFGQKHIREMFERCGVEIPVQVVT